VYLGSLFECKTQNFSDSTPVNNNEFGDDISTGASPSKKNPSETSDSHSPNGKNPKLERLRNKMKGNDSKSFRE